MNEKLFLSDVLKYVNKKMEPFAFVGNIEVEKVRMLYHLLKKGGDPRELRHTHLPEKWVIAFNDEKKTFAVINSDWLYKNMYVITNYSKITAFPKKLVPYHIDKNQPYEEFLEHYEETNTLQNQRISGFNQRQGY